MRAVWILVGVLLGAFFGFAIGFTLAQSAVALPGLDESEILGLGLLAGFGTPVLGAVIGGVLGARATRP